jgi:hypothetical protein
MGEINLGVQSGNIIFIHYIMDFFYISVITVAVILLIIILTFVGIQMKSNAGSKQAFPPSMSDCPDYWQMDSCGNCVIPSKGSKNSGTLYNANNRLVSNSSNTVGFNSSNNSINFNASGWTGSSSAICTKRNWTSNNGVFWDGVTNYNNC